MMGLDSSVGIATGWMSRRLNPGGGEIFRVRLDRRPVRVTAVFPGGQISPPTPI